MNSEMERLILVRVDQTLLIQQAILERLNDMATNEQRILADADTIASVIPQLVQQLSDAKAALAAIQANADNDADFAPAADKLDAAIASAQQILNAAAPDPASDTSAPAAGTDTGVTAEPVDPNATDANTQQ